MYGINKCIGLAPGTKRLFLQLASSEECLSDIVAQVKSLIFFKRLRQTQEAIKDLLKRIHDAGCIGLKVLSRWKSKL